MMFIGREEELSKLETWYHSESVRTCAVYGRRHIGKTALMNRFCDGKPSIRFNLKGNHAGRILDHAASTIGEHLGYDSGKVREGLRDFDGIIDFLGSLDPAERTVVVMDGFPDAVRLFSDVPASLARYIDGKMRRQRIFLILCGSSVPTMVGELNECRKPLFQRFPVQLKLLPLTYPEARRFHEGLPEKERMRMYAIASGIPLYHELMSAYGSSEEAVKGLFLGKAASLYGEARMYLEPEVSPIPTYNRVLSLIADGVDDISGLGRNADLSITRCREVLDTLVGIDVVARYGMYRGKTVPYRITDGFMRFYFSVLYGNEAILDMSADRAYEALRHRIDIFYGKRFEDLCAEYLKTTETCIWCGCWRGKVPVIEDGRKARGADGRVRTADAHIDVVARVLRGGLVAVLMCDCNFMERRSGAYELGKLTNSADRAMMGGENIEYVLFSSTGFTSDLLDVAEIREDLRLVTLEDIGAWAESASPSVPGSRGQRL